jgi:putative hydrolase of the HAD superfamily
MINVKVTQIPIPGSFELLEKAYYKGLQLYALTDNIREIISYLKDKYEFWKYFNGIICSAEVGFLKPSKEIYTCLLEEHSLDPSETLFLDDIDKNVQGAKKVGIHALKFINAAECKKDLRKFKISL